MPETQIQAQNWLNVKLRSLYDDPVYKNGSVELQNHYKRKAYDKWVVPYFNKTKVENPWKSVDEFVDSSKLVARRQAEIRIEENQRQAEKQQSAMLATTDKALASIASFTEMLSHFVFQDVKHPGKINLQDTNVLTKPLKKAENFYEEQAQLQEDRIQELGGHDIHTLAANTIAEAAMFEATGAAKGANLLKIANPRTASFTTRLLKTEWNSAVTGLFWGASTGTKPEHIHSDLESFVLLGLGGESLKFLRTLTKVAPKGTTQQLVKEAASKLVSGEGVALPKQTKFDINNTQHNRDAAIAELAEVLNATAAKQQGKQDINKAFKELTSDKQNVVLTHVFSTMSQMHDVQATTLAKEIQPLLIQETEQKAQQIAPVVKNFQDEINQFIKSQVPSATPDNIVQMKTGAILPHHLTTEKSPIQHVGARISWLTNQLKDKGLSTRDRIALQVALEDEQGLYSKIKKVKQETNIDKNKITLGTGASGLGDRTTRSIKIGDEVVGNLNYDISGNTLTIHHFGGPEKDYNVLSNKLGRRGLTSIKEQLKKLHPEVKYIQGIRVGGARGEEGRSVRVSIQ